MDAVDAVDVRYEELPAALDAERALDPSEPKIHKEFDSNLCFQRTVDTGGVDAAIEKRAPRGRGHDPFRPP